MPKGPGCVKPVPCSCWIDQITHFEFLMQHELDEEVASDAVQKMYNEWDNNYKSL